MNILIMSVMKKNAGLSKAAKEEHARDLPLMNGIKEVIKSVGVLNPGSPDYREALCNLSARLKLLQVRSTPIMILAMFGYLLALVGQAVISTHFKIVSYTIGLVNIDYCY